MLPSSSVQGFWFGVAAGPNRQIVMMSKHFRFDLYLNLVLLVVAVIGNSILIPRYGLVGAAIATAIILSMYNIAGVSFLWIRQRLFPYTRKTIVAVAVAVVVFVDWALDADSGGPAAEDAAAFSHSNALVWLCYLGAAITPGCQSVGGKSVEALDCEEINCPQKLCEKAYL